MTQTQPVIVVGVDGGASQCESTAMGNSQTVPIGG